MECTKQNPEWNFKVFFDGACPICSREMNFLKRRNIRGTLAFEDTSNPGFDPTHYGISTDTNRVIHGILPDGTIVRGVEVFRRAYAEIGLGWLLAPTGWPVIRIFFDWAYLVFARYRKKISGFFWSKSCEGNQCDSTQ